MAFSGGDPLEEKQQIGDGSDNFGHAAGQAARAAKQISQQAARAGTEAAALRLTAISDPAAMNLFSHLKQRLAHLIEGSYQDEANHGR